MLADVHRDALRAAAAGVEVRLGPMPETWVSGDRDDLRRAVWNLIDNALKYTRTGAVDLRLRAENGRADLTVRDTGTVIAESAVGHGTTFLLTLPLAKRPPRRSGRREGELLGVSRVTGPGRHS
jgi:signal transduction histidine kinase